MKPDPKLRFIVDAHLPMALAFWLRERGYDVIHTRELPEQNATEDNVLLRLSMQEKRVVISKDRDFVEQILLTGRPHQLRALTMGNIVNRDLITLVARNWPRLEELLAKHRFVELSADHLVVHF